jgi:replicative DNA helicase
MSLPAPATVNIDVEQALLGACLVEPEAVDAVDGLVEPEDFSETLHVELFRMFVEARREGRRFNAQLMLAFLGARSHQDLGGLTTGEYLARLAASSAGPLNAPDYARIIAETAAYRRLVALANELRDRAGQGHSSGSYVDIATEAIAELDKISARRASAPTRVSIGEAAGQAAEAAEDRALHGVDEGVSFGLRDLNRVCRLYPGELTILAARPSMGKTTVGLSVAMAAARAGEGVLFFSLEMSAVSVAQRALSDMCFDGYNAAIQYSDIRDGKLPDDGLERIRHASEIMAALPLVIEDQAGLTVSQIIARTRQSRRRFEQAGKALGLVVIDHLGLVAATDRYAGMRHLELGAITSALKVMAKDMGVPVLLLCQLSRGVESRDNKRPQLSDLRESGRIEEDADAVLLLYREAYYLERARENDPEKDAQRVERLIACQNIIEINVAKQRQGATRTVEAFVSMPSNAVRDLNKGL